jgi:hypothetical protein
VTDANDAAPSLCAALNLLISANAFNALKSVVPVTVTELAPPSMIAPAIVVLSPAPNMLKLPVVGTPIFSYFSFR